MDRAAIRAMVRIVCLEMAMPWYRELLAATPREEAFRGVAHGVRCQLEPGARQLLKDHSDCDYPRVASEARDGFGYSRA